MRKEEGRRGRRDEKEGRGKGEEKKKGEGKEGAEGLVDRRREGEKKGEKELESVDLHFGCRPLEQHSAVLTCVFTTTVRSDASGSYLARQSHSIRFQHKPPPRACITSELKAKPRTICGPRNACTV